VPIVPYEMARAQAGSAAITETPAKALIASSAGGGSARGTVEKLHSRAETPKGPTAVGPFDFSD
jgi:hypothetical protein